MKKDKVTKEEFDEFIEELKEKAADSIIIVEGKNDKKALVELGIPYTSIRHLNKPIYQIIEMILKFRKKCIILTDLDKKGEQLYKRINDELSRNGVQIDREPRKFLARTQLNQIEGMSGYYERMEE